MVARELVTVDGVVEVMHSGLGPGAPAVAMNSAISDHSAEIIARAPRQGRAAW